MLDDYACYHTPLTGLKELLGPFYGAIAVPSVTRYRCCRCCCCCPCCRCCRCGHRFYIAIHQVSLLLHAALRYSYSWLRLILAVVSTVAKPGEWQCKIRIGGVRRLAVANGPDIFKCFLSLTVTCYHKANVACYFKNSWSKLSIRQTYDFYILMS